MMEEKKLDLNTIIGFILIFGLLLWIMYQNQPTEAEIAEQTKKEQAAKQVVAPANAALPTTVSADSLNNNPAELAKLQSTLGGFAYSAALPTAKETFTTLENDLMLIKIANKGGAIAEVTLKNFKKIDKNSKELVALIKNNNSNFNLKLLTKDNKALETKNLFFEPTLSNNGTDQVLSMRLKAGADQYLEFKYVLKSNNYMLDFDVFSKGLSTVLNTSKPLDLEWNMKTFRNEKSVSYENRYTELRFDQEGKKDYLGLGNNDQETATQVTYVAFKQHLFTSILASKTAFDTVEVFSNNLVDDDKIDTVFTKQYKANFPIAFQNGEINKQLNWYFGPTDYKILKNYDKNLEDIVPLGWGIFGWINKFVFIPVFGFLSNFISLGWAIVLFTILVKLAMSPVTYKSFLSQAKMKVLRPEITELGEKFAKDPMKKQQETMKLYNKAGVNPMAGCIPALIQMPIFYALFQFFPAEFSLRQQGFLWADDLSSFDSILKLPFSIPVYGDHVSLFALLAAIAIFFYMKMTTGDQPMAPPQEGMPDMAKIMKIMIYVSPIMMLFLFNNYGSGLSLYNFVSNLITIGIMLLIKNYIVDNDKIHAKIQENKLKEPKKQSSFQRKLQEVMEQAEAQKAANKKK